MTLLGNELFSENDIKCSSENDLIGLCPFDVAESEENREKAYRNICVQLDEWRKQPGYIDEDELEFPTLKSILKTEKLIKDYQQYRIQQRLYRPVRMVANGEGGVCLRVTDKEKSISETFEIYYDGSMEYRCIKNGEMIIRKPIA